MKYLTISVLFVFLNFFWFSCSKSNDVEPKPVTAVDSIKLPVASDTLKLPVVSTSVISAITQTSAIGGGNVTSDGGYDIVQRGICWSVSKDPTVVDNKTQDGAVKGAFFSKLSNLADGSTYFVRAYATNKNGTAYGNTVIFSAIIIGELYRGGVLAYILLPGDSGYDAQTPHGLVTTINDVGKNKWGLHTSIDNTSTNYGSGKANTAAIISSKKKENGVYPIFAATDCDDLIYGGYDDWYLPSRDELNKLYINRMAIGNFNTTSQQAPWYYWTSSQAGIEAAWIQNFTDGTMSTYDKQGIFEVRPVRAF